MSPVPTLQEIDLKSVLALASDVTIGQAVRAFMLAETSRLAAATQTWYEMRLSALAKELGKERALADVIEADLMAWSGRLDQRRLSPATRRGHIRAAKRLFKWLFRKGVLNVDLSADLKLPRMPRTGKKGISETNVRLILEATRTEPRDYALLRFLEATGCRRAGVANLLLSDLNLDVMDPRLRRRVSVREKGAKERTVLLTPNALAALERWLELRPETSDQHVFIGREPGEDWHPLHPDAVSGILRRYKERLELVGPCSPHQWRHRFCRKRLQEGMDLSRVSQLAGHEDPSITVLFYGGFSVDDLQDGYDQKVEDLEI